MGAAAPQRRAARDSSARNVLQSPDRALQAGQVERGTIRSKRSACRPTAAVELGTLGPPLPVEHDRQPVDDHVEKLPTTSPTTRRRDQRGRRLGQEVQHAIRRSRSDDRTELEDGRYIAITRPRPARQDQHDQGSSRLDMLSTAASTSSS